MKNIKLVVLMAGTSSRLQPMSYEMPKGMFSYLQTPSLYTMLVPYINKGLKDITIVVSPSNKAMLENFFTKAFSKVKINFVVQTEPLGPLHAFQTIGETDKPTLLLLGDTTCETNSRFDESFIAYSRVTDYDRWCLIEEENGFVSKFVDKPKEKPNTDKAVIGLYYFKNYKLLNKLLAMQYKKLHNEYQLSSLLEEYCKIDKMKAIEFNNWQDTGSLESLSNAKLNSLIGRVFNKFRVDKNGIITKISNFNVLKREVYWYEKISNTPLSIYMPQFFGYNIEGDTLNYKIEYLPYKTLAEYFVYYPIIDSNWKYIFENLVSSLKDFWYYKGFECDIDIISSTQKMYADKTINRIKNWNQKDILSQEKVIINGKEHLGFNQVYEKLKDRIDNLIKDSKNFVGVIHGDPSFQNVLYSPIISKFKFVDPRGSFPDETIFGDIRYDLAKLRHCYHGLYDYIIFDLFNLEKVSNNNFNYFFLTEDIVDYNLFDNILKDMGYNIDDIELIEGLLFISMIPFHSDKPLRQILFYLIGLQCLNNQL